MDKKLRELVMGKLYFKNKDYKMAEKSFVEYLSTNPDDFQAVKLLAQVYEHLRNFPKAFDSYERCYLLEPDRKGVLLDLCRLLLMNDQSLSHVDQHKWLQLAIQVFPANPIVLSLRSSLPPQEQKPQPSSTVDNAILEKLCLMEDRLVKIESRLGKIEKKMNVLTDIETKMANLNLNQKLPQSETQPSLVAPVEKEKQKEPTPVESRPILFGQVADEKKPITPVENRTSSIFSQSSPPKATGSLFTQITEDKKTTPIKPLSNIFGQNSTTPAERQSFFNFEEKKTAPTQSVFGQGLQEKKTSPEAHPNLFANAIEKMKIPEFKFGGSFLNQSPPSDEQKNNAAAGGDDDNDNENDNDNVQADEIHIENTCDMEPIEIKTGEEDEQIIFEQRCKLFRFRDKEYKERGIGTIKVLKHKETGKGRLIMRRDLVNLVCLNCWNVSKIERVRDTQVRFAGIDASDGEGEMTVLVVKLKTEQLTDEFMSHLKNLFQEDS